MVVRIVPQAFVSDGFLIGPGRHDFGSAVHSWSVDGQTLPDDPSLDLPASYVQVITPEMGVAGAQSVSCQDRTRWAATISLKSLGLSRLRCCSAGARHSGNRVQITEIAGKRAQSPLPGLAGQFA